MYYTVLSSILTFQYVELRWLEQNVAVDNMAGSTYGTQSLVLNYNKLSKIDCPKYMRRSRWII
jgi:hypothetical protein